MSVRQQCFQVSAACPIEKTTYGYQPNLPAHSTLLALFAICAILQIGFGIYHRAWSFMVAIAGGCIMEAVGYGGRIMMYNNVWSENAFRIQICCLILAPSFIAAGIYLSLKHIIIHVDPAASRIKPRLYTWVFIGADVASIFVQAAGGGIAAGAKRTNQKMLNLGNNLMIAGIGVQIAIMAVCGIMALDYFIRHKRRGGASRSYAYKASDTSGHAPLVSHTRFQVFVCVEAFAYVTVLIRCIYRLPEMAGGWGNPLMRNQVEFLVLDGLMVVMAVIAFTVFHPGWWFPPMTTKWQKMRSASEKNGVHMSDSDTPKDF